VVKITLGGSLFSSNASTPACSESLAADRSALMSFYTVTLAAGGVIGAILGGVVIRSFHADGLLWFGFGLSLITFTLILVLVRGDAARARATPQH